MSQSLITWSEPMRKAHSFHHCSKAGFMGILHHFCSGLVVFLRITCYSFFLNLNYNTERPLEYRINSNRCFMSGHKKTRTTRVQAFKIIFSENWGDSEKVKRHLYNLLGGWLYDNKKGLYIFLFCPYMNDYSPCFCSFSTVFGKFQNLTF